MKQVKIDEDVYEILEGHFLAQKELTENDIMRCQEFFLAKFEARMDRKSHIDDYYRKKNLESVGIHY